MAQSVLWGCSPNVQHAATSQSPELEGFSRAGCNLSPQSPHWDMSAEPEHLKESSMYPTPKPCSSHLLLLFLLFLLPRMIRPHIEAMSCILHSLPFFPQHLACLLRDPVVKCPWWNLGILEGEDAHQSAAFLRSSVAGWLPKIPAGELACWAAGWAWSQW